MKIRTSSHGFTLIELLVVIVIIAILAGISLPVFSRIMERGKVVQELSNLRQIGIASLAYINDNDGYLGSTTDPWVTKWAELLGGKAAEGENDAEEGKYIQDNAVFLSPFDIRNDADTISFGPNAAIASGSNNNTELWKSTSSLVFIAPTLSAVDVFTGTKSSSSSIARTQEFGSHSDGRRTSVLFADFHVEAVGVAELRAEGTGAKFKWIMP